MSTALLRRRGVARVAGLLAASALVGVGALASASPAAAEDESITAILQEFAAETFAGQADELPTGLVEAIQRDLGISPAEYLANAAAAKVAANVVAELRAAGIHIKAAVFKPENQSLGVYVSAGADLGAIEATGAVVLGEKPPSAGYPTHVTPYEDLKGGYGYIDATGEQGRCSVGFNGYAANGDPVVLTAGHCNPANAEAEWVHLDVDAPLPADPNVPITEDQLGDELGTGGEFVFGENQDAGLFALTGPTWTPRPVVSTWGDGEGDPREGEVVVTDRTDPIVGAPVCRSGATSGYQCGEIVAIDQTVTVGESPEDPNAVEVVGFHSTACSEPGDSGGPFLSGTAAVGTLTGGPSSITCADWDANNPAHTSFAYAVAGSENSAEAVFGDGWELAVQVSTPTVTSPEDGAEVDPAVTIEGTVENASDNHRVSVSVDGGDPVVDDVSADGKFTVALEDLEPGEHSYEVRATYGAHSESEAAEGSFTVSEAPAVDELVVEAPTEGQTTGDATPDFSGTGQAGATVTLTVGEDVVGETEIGEDGSWSITPESDLPFGVRFDAVLTQEFDGESQSVTIAGLGIQAPEVTVTSPEGDSEVAGDVVFEGTSFPGASISLLLEAAAPADDTTGDDDGTDANTIQPREARAEGDDDGAGDDVEVWDGEFEIDDDGNWSFTPAEALPAGAYTITASATLEGGDPELSDSEAVVSFSVASGGGDDDGADDGGDDDLPDTGSSNTTWMIIAGVVLLAGGGAAIAIRARNTTGRTPA